jgi:hypothetical protein
LKHKYLLTIRVKGIKKHGANRVGMTPTPTRSEKVKVKGKAIPVTGREVP